MIVLAAAAAAAMRREAEAAYPEECCGLLVGRTEANGTLSISRAVAAANVAAGDRRRRFEVDPAVRFRLMRELRGADAALVGHYHSHPDHPAVPSAEDLAMAFEPDLIWLIIAVGSGGAGAIAAFQPQPGASGFTPQPLEIAGTAGSSSGD